jgi:hypothetical protein
MSALIDGYFIDVVETENHSYSSDVTAHPVEQGADVADNVRAKPCELTFTNAVVSDTPIGAAATQRQGLSQGGSLLLGNSTPLSQSTTKPSQAALQKLEKLWRDREPVQVVSNLKKYDSMVLDKLDITRNAKTAGGLIFTAHFTEVIIVRNNRVTVAIPDGAGQSDLGGGNAKNDPDHTPGQSSLIGTRILLVSYQVGDPRTQQLHTAPIGQPDGTQKRGVNPVYVGPDDPQRSPNRGNIECYLVTQGGNTYQYEQQFQTHAIDAPADGYYYTGGPNGVSAGNNPFLQTILTGASINNGRYFQLRGTSSQPITYNPSSNQISNAGGTPMGKSPSAITGGQTPGAAGNPANSAWQQAMQPTGFGF